MKKLILAAAALLALAASAQAQQFPTRPVTLIVPWPPGGSTDIAMRALATATEKHLGQSIVIENRPGAAGTLGPGNMAANARPDGYTVAQFPISVFRIPYIQKTAWDPTTDFTYVIHLTGYTFGVVVRADSPFKTFNDMIEHARGQSRQGQLRNARRRHEPAHHDGADRQAEGHQVDAGAVQGRRRQHECDARRAHRRDGELDRLGRARQLRQVSPARDVGRRAHQELAERADAEGESASTWCRTRRSASAVRRAWIPAVVKVLHDAFKKGMEEQSYKDTILEARHGAVLSRARPTITPTRCSRSASRSSSSRSWG